MAGKQDDVTDVDMTTTNSSNDTAATVSVTVAAPYQVRFDGIVHIAGETLEVDADTAHLWERAEFVRRT